MQSYQVLAGIHSVARGIKKLILKKTKSIFEKINIFLWPIERLYLGKVLA